MTLPPELSTYGKDLLEKLSFSLTNSSDNGMWKHYSWANTDMEFTLTYDKGYYECNVIPRMSPINSLSLIPLLKFLKNDKTFYNKELDKADLWRTLTPDGYIQLLNNNYSMIEKFMSNYNQEKFDSYNKFEFDYDGI